MKINENIVDIAKYRRDKSFETLNDIKKLLANGMLSSAMNRIYYR